MQRISVDLPDPDGPQITMRSPRPTARLMSRSTWKSPYHLLRLVMLTIGLSVMLICSITAGRVQPVLDQQGVTRHSETKDEVDHSGKGKAREQRCRRRPVRIGERGAQLTEQIEQRDDRDQRGILEQRDEAVDQTWDHMPQCLRLHDQRRRLPPG